MPLQPSDLPIERSIRGPLSEDEKAELARLESVIERGLATFVEVGFALVKIRDSRLYCQTHSTFESYCRERWGFSRQRGYQLIAAAEVSTVVVSAGLPPPETEREARERYYTAEDDGLTKRWRGRVWMNPPYGAMGGDFVAKLIEEHEAGRVTAAIACLNGRSFDARWFQPLWNYPVCFTDHRSSFRNPFRDAHDRPTVGSIFVYFGRDFDSFIDAFSRFGRVVKDPSGREWQKRFSSPPASRRADAG